MKLDLDSFLQSCEPILPFEAGEDNSDLIEHGMNFDITARLRKLFSFVRSSSNQPDEKDTAEHISNTLTNGSTTNLPTSSFLKRKAAEKENSDYKVLTKYRKLDTEFPKVINKPFEDDTTKSFVNDRKKNKQQHQKLYVSMPAHNRHHLHSGSGSSSASNKHLDPADELLKRRCRKPTPKLMTVRTTFADCEFSDDELDDFLKPNEVEQKFKKPPPPLIQKKTGGILVSTIIPHLKPLRKVLTASSSNSSLNRAKEVSFLFCFFLLEKKWEEELA